jgi:predicted unusual protein kinase regulating ubiquinone biosynthesis (AarF/ABC1/UbiB family)
MRHLAAGINGELDLINEARNCEMLAAIFADRDDIVFPRIHWEHTTERVLVQEFLHGIPLTDHARLDAGHYDKPLLAQKGTDAFLQMALIEGVFHADPHPGNLLAMTGNRVGFLDFGMIGRLSQKRRDQLLMMIGAMVMKSVSTRARLRFTPEWRCTKPWAAASSLARSGAEEPLQSISTAISPSAFWPSMAPIIMSN